MAKFLDKCMDSNEWIEMISGYKSVSSFITLEELSELSVKLDIDTVANHWDYPLSETQMLAEDDERKDQEFQLVRFSDGIGGFEYRWCEV